MLLYNQEISNASHPKEQEREREMMDWMNGSLNPPLVHRPENSLSFLYNCNYNYHDHHPAVEMKYPVMEKNVMNYPAMSEAERKKRLTNKQLEFLENNFIEDQKLEPERKMKLAQELGLQPRQIAVWFQNRRARWKAKELERSYDTLKLEYEAVFKEKERLQEEVSALKTLLRQRQANMNHQVSTGHTETSGEETIESTSMKNPCPMKWPSTETSRKPVHQKVDQPMYALNDNDYNPITPMPSYWNTVLPSYP